MLVIPRIITLYRRKKRAFKIYSQVVFIRDQIQSSYEQVIFDKMEFFKITELSPRKSLLKYMLLFYASWVKPKYRKLSSEYLQKLDSVDILRHFDSPDYNKIYKFYESLKERNRYIVESKYILPINRTCVRLAEDVIITIDWKKYI